MTGVHHGSKLDGFKAQLEVGGDPRDLDGGRALPGHGASAGAPQGRHGEAGGMTLQADISAGMREAWKAWTILLAGPFKAAARVARIARPFPRFAHGRRRSGPGPRGFNIIISKPEDSDRAPGLAPPRCALRGFGRGLQAAKPAAGWTCPAEFAEPSVHCLRNAAREDGMASKRGMAALALAAAALWMPTVAAAASERVALVIGNAAYEHTDALRNPGNDAAAVAAALGRLGFEVVLGTDLDLDGLYDKLGEFDAASRGADVTLFFYAGHGLQVEGRNWLAPVDAKLDSKLDLRRGAVELDTVLEHMRGTKRLVYLDACRNNPLAGDLARSLGLSRAAAAKRGLARVTGVPGTLIGYATAPDDVAADGEGRNSPFTEALLAHIETPGLSVNDMFGEVSKAVVRATGGEQVPWSNSSLGRFYLVSGAEPLPPQGPAASAAEGTAPPSPEVADKAAEIVLPGGITLADWALLAEDRLKAGDHARLLEEAGAHLREHGRVRSVEAVRDRAVSGLVEEVRVETWEDAPPALERIARLEAAAGPRPEFLRLKARAQGLLGDYAAEEAARLQWLRSVPQTHPDRRGMLSALAGARANREASRRFSELLGRPFSPERREGSVGWTDLHYAALLDLPGAVAALCDAGMAADARLKTGSQPFGGDLERAFAALGHESFEGRRANGETPLMVASLANARDAAAGLADCGADVGAADGGGLTPLHHAARGNAPEAAGLLVDLGADVGAADGGGLTPLHHAARGNAPEAAGLLVDLGADVSAADGGGLTPLHHAARGNAPEAAGLLVDLGADVNAADGDGWTPLSLALRDEEHHEVQAALRSRGGKATSPEEVERGLGLGVEERRLIQMGLASTGHDPGPADGVFGRRTRAALRAWQESSGLDATGHLTREQSEGLAGPGREEAARLRAEAEARLRAEAERARKKREEEARLQAEAERERQAREEEARERFSELLGRPFSPNRKGGSAGWTDLHYAAVLDLPGVVAALCRAGMAADTRLFWKGDVEFSERVKRRLGGWEGWFNSDADTPLMVASSANARDAAAALIACGADVNAMSVRTGGLVGITPLTRAGQWNSLETAKLLIDRGADVNKADEYGSTALHWAAHNNSLETAKLLIDRGAQVNRADHRGETPLDDAIKERHRKMQALLRRHGAKR